MKENKIAIVGMACRFPGNAETPEAYWDILKNGQDVVTEIDSDRWGIDTYWHPKREEPGKSYTFSAGILSAVDQFDAAFFGISPREAAQMDPQQRLLLELTWEAMENAGHKPEKIAGSKCAVYVGVASNDYAHRRTDDLASIDAYSMTGATASIAANRISYVFDLRGPSLAIDTACSSALVAVHHASRSLMNGEASMAIAGGINMLLHPFPFIGFSKASMLSPEGRSKAFDESGSGYVRSEGAAIFILKPLEQAENDGDLIHAVIRASGVNCDGRTSGITVPSAEMQSALLNSVYDEAGVTPDQLTYLEAHGTGTSVGDPIETKAIGLALGQKRDRENPLLIGSVKTNMGHLETASGAAGLCKAILCLKHRGLPPSLHFQNPNPNIDFEDLNLRVITTYTPLMELDKPLFIGVNSFGFGGANAHILLENYSFDRSRSKKLADRFPPLFLSARTEKALQDLALRYHDILIKTSPPNYYDLAFSALNHRQVLPYRLAAMGHTINDIAEQLKRYADGETTSTLIEQQLLNNPARLALVFSGNGSQWQGMGRALLEEEPVFKETIAQIDGLLKKYAEFSLMDEFQLPEDESRLDQTEIAQPLLFALQVGIVQVIREHGLAFDAVVGHSVGEIAAAWAAGALTLEHATRVIFERSQAQGATRGAGRMAAMGISMEDFKKTLELLSLEGLVEIAGINSPSSITVSGSLSALEKLGGHLSGQGKFYRLLDLDYAFHSSHMDPVENRIKDALKDLEPGTSKTPYISTVTGETLSGTELNADYWWRNIRKPVLFGKAIDTLIDDGIKVFLEIGPQPILRHYVNECLKNRDQQGDIFPTISRKDADRNALLREIYRSHLAGCHLDTKIHFPEKGQRVSLPYYPWQREHHWYPLTTEGYDLVNRHREHPLLGYRLKELEAGWENHIDAELLPYLADHVVDDAVVVPAAAFVEMALAASKSWYRGETHTIENLEILAPVILDNQRAKTTRFVLDTKDGSFTIGSKNRLTDDPFTLNVKGRLAGKSFKSAIPASNMALKDARLIDSKTHYQLAERVGLSYGEAFQGIVEVQVKESAAVAELQPSKRILDSLEHYVLHPSLLDSCFQILVDLFAEKITAGFTSAMIPVQLGRLDLHRPGGAVKWVEATLLKQSPRSVLARFALFDEERLLVAEIENCRFRGIELDRTAKRLPACWKFQPLLKTKLDANLPSAIPDIAGLLAEVKEIFEKQEKILQRKKFCQHVLPLMDVMVSSYACQAIGQLSGDEGLNETEVAPPFKPLLQRLLTILEEDELVHQQNGQWYLESDAEIPDPKDIWLNIVGEYPACVPELMLLSFFGQQLDRVLQGQIDEDIWEGWFSGNSWHQLYDIAPSFRAMNLAVQKIVRQTAEHWPDNRRLRILEMNTGEGIMTRWLSPILTDHECDYYLTSAKDEDVTNLRNQFEGEPSMVIGKFDPDTDQYDGMGDDFQGFDIIIAANSLHQSKDLESALIHIRQKMRPSGLLVLMERWPDRFSDLTAGLDPQWWHWNEQSKQVASSSLSPKEWRMALKSQKFVEITPFIESSAATDSGVFLMLAKSTETVPSIVTKESAVENNIWLILLDEGQVSKSVGMYVKQQLEERGQDVLLLEAGKSYLQKTERHTVLDVCDPEHFRKFISKYHFKNIVHLMGLPYSLGEPNEMARDFDFMEQQDLRCTSTLYLLQALEETDLDPRLWIITWGAAVLPHERYPKFLSTPAQAPLWGLGRVIMNEYPELQCHLVDLQSRNPDDLFQIADRLSTELFNPNGENEIVLTNEARYGLRLSKTFLRTVNTGKNGSISLDFFNPGPLKNLYWKRKETAALKPEEIEIRPHASGLNFRDIMYAMGLLSDEALESGFAGATLGMEVSGVVTRTGRDVDGFEVGDEVMGFAPACFGSAVITETTAITQKPPQWTYEEAATISTTFFTVYYALEYLAHLQPGEKILIHGAAGGVGIAAIQFARYLGAEIFATAGSEEKRSFVKSMGADHVMDSRSLAFADEILTITQGKGIDVVLNSISGEAINRNLRVLKPFGRFLELGKRDFYENNKIGLRPFRNNISYFGIDADQLLTERPDLAAKLFREMMELFKEGVLRPLPHRVFPAQRIEDAFRYMQQSRQIGKVVVSFESGFPTPVDEEVIGHLALSEKGSYLISGGLSGFGLKTAQWLVSKGARSLVLLGRRGAATDEAEKALAEMRSSGATIHAIACDVTDRNRVKTVLADIKDTLPPLKGVIHAAMVIDDGLIRNLDHERFQKVLKPKILGAWHLHEFTTELQLEFFVMYSSATTLFGNPGQSNYVAANYYLEALANYRRLSGLPGAYVSWGAVSDAGFLARNEAVKDALQSRFGGSALTSEKALEMLEKILISEETGVAVIDFEWPVIQRVMPAATSGKYEFQNSESERLVEGEETEDLYALISSLPKEEMSLFVSDLLVKEISQILRFPVEKISIEKSVLDLGMDSLMGMELVMSIEKAFGIRLPLMALTEGASIKRIAEKICEQLAGMENAGLQQNETEEMIASTTSIHGEALTEEDISAISEEVLDEREAV